MMAEKPDSNAPYEIGGKRPADWISPSLRNCLLLVPKCPMRQHTEVSARCAAWNHDPGQRPHGIARDGIGKWWLYRPVFFDNGILTVVTSREDQFNISSAAFERYFDILQPCPPNLKP